MPSIPKCFLILRNHRKLDKSLWSRDSPHLHCWVKLQKIQTRLWLNWWPKYHSLINSISTQNEKQIPWQFVKCTETWSSQKHYLSAPQVGGLCRGPASKCCCSIANRIDLCLALGFQSTFLLWFVYMGVLNSSREFYSGVGFQILQGNLEKV